jgi:lipoate-protein ligase A
LLAIAVLTPLTITASFIFSSPFIIDNYILSLRVHPSAERSEAIPYTDLLHGLGLPRLRAVTHFGVQARRFAPRNDIIYLKRKQVGAAADLDGFTRNIA